MYAKENGVDVISKFIKDPKLIAILAGGQLIDWNLQPNKTSWFVTKGMMGYYEAGAF